MEKMVASIIILGVIIVTYAYQLGGPLFWPIHDAGQLMFPIALLLYAKHSVLLSCCGWIWFGGVFNAFTTSLFFDVTTFGLNQKISIALISMSVVICGIIYAIKRYKKKKALEKICKRDARRQYREIRERIEHIEYRIEKYDKSIDNFLTQLMK